MRDMPNATKGALIASLFAFAALAAAATVQNSPTFCTGTTWANCNNAFADGGGVASASVNANYNKSDIWMNYGFTFPANTTIQKVVVRADFYASNANGFINVRVAQGPVSWGPSHIVGGNTAEQTYLIDVTNDFNWTATGLGDIRVQATCFKTGSSGKSTCKLDWLPVEVNYTTS